MASMPQTYCCTGDTGSAGASSSSPTSSTSCKSKSPNVPPQFVMKNRRDRRAAAASARKNKGR